MATIKTSGIGVVQFVGTIGDTCFAYNQYGQYARANVPPTFPGTSYQLAANARLTTVKGRWNTITEAQRQLWNNAAASGEWQRSNRVGEYCNPSGVDLFVSLNMSVAIIPATLDIPPSKPSLVSPGFTGFSYISQKGQDLITCLFNDTSIPSGTRIVVWGTDALSPGITRPRPSVFRQIASYDSTVFSNTLNVSTAFWARFGDPFIPSKIWCMCEIMDDASGVRMTIGKHFGQP